MRLKNITIALLLLLSSGVRAQLRSTGSVPPDLKMTVEQLYSADLQRAKKYAGSRGADRQQVMEASYQINKMMASGRILYGDEVSRMVERIADTLLKDYSDLRSELRFYTVNSPEVNAFATGQGMVFVNLGLVAQVENEAQLAFILSHEIIHYYRAHAMEELVKDKNRKEKRETDVDYDADNVELDHFLRWHNRSRSMESEADSLGIELFYRRSPYYKGVTEGVFDVLQYGALPFDDVPFDTNYFNTPYYQLTGCWLHEVTGITSRDNYDDSRSTHPNILTRRRQCSALLHGKKGETFVTISQTDFEALREKARMECVRQEVIHGQYARAFYNAWLLKRNPQNDVAQLDRYMAYALYGYALHRVHETIVAQQDYTMVQGESQQVYYALQNMSVEEMLLVALHAVWQAHLAYPANGDYALMADDLMEQLRFAAKRSSEDYLSEVSDNSEYSGKSENSEGSETISKYDRIRQKRKTQTESTPASYALTDLMMADSTFGDLLTNHLDGTADTTRVADTVGRNGLMVFNPVSLVFSDLSDQIKVAKSAAVERRLTRRIMGAADRFGKHGVDFSDDGLHQMVSDTQYNDFMTLCEWMNEFWLTKGKFRIQRMTQPMMNDLTARHDAREVNLTAMLNVENCRGEASITSAIFIPTIPLTLIGMFTGIEKTALATISVDAREGKILSRQTYSYGVADHNDLLDAMLYDSYRRAATGKLPKGFLGRRLNVSGGVNLGLSGARPIRRGHILAFTPWAAIEYAIQRNRSLVVSARYHKAYDDVVESDWRGMLFGLIGDDWDEPSTDTKPVSRSMWTFNLDLRRYPRSDFAPLGLYYSYGLHWIHMSELDGDGGVNTFGFHGGVGRNYVFFDRLVLNYEVSYAYTYGFLKVMGFTKDTRPNAHYGDAIYSNLISIRLGLGFLPF